MMLKISPVSYTVLARPKQHLHSKKRKDLAESTDVAPAKYPPKVKSELFLQLQSAREGISCVPWFVRVLGFLQWQGLTSFLWSRSLFLIGVFLGVSCGILSIQKSLLGFSKRGGQVISLYTQSWLASILCLIPSAYIMPSVLIPSALESRQLYDPVSLRIPLR